jgi:hypothetical protein
MKVPTITLNITRSTIMLENKVLEEILRSAPFGLHITPLDWEAELAFSIQEGSFEKSMLAAHKANIFLKREELEDLLLNATIRGQVCDAMKALVALNRGMELDEYMLLLESSILRGNVAGVCDMTDKESIKSTAFLHLTMAIAVAKKMKMLSCRKTPSHISLSSWILVCAKELSLFKLKGRRIFIQDFPLGKFFIFDEGSVQKLLGALIAYNDVTKEDIERITSQVGLN